MDKLNPVAKIEKKALVALAIFLGKIRLIDNTILLF
jgi:pantothenate synthetase